MEPVTGLATRSGHCLVAMDGSRDSHTVHAAIDDVQDCGMRS